MIVLDDHIVHDNVLPVDSVHIAERWILLYSHSSLIYKYLKIVLVNLKKKKSIWKLTFKISFFLSFLHANTHSVISYRKITFKDICMPITLKPITIQTRTTQILKGIFIIEKYLIYQNRKKSDTKKIFYIHKYISN